MSWKFFAMLLLIPVVIFVAISLTHLFIWKLIAITSKIRLRKLCQHLESIGIRARISMLREHTYLDLWKTEWILDEYTIGTIELENTEISSINVLKSGGQNSYYRYEYVVRPAKLSGDIKKETKLVIKRKSFFSDSIVYTEWKGHTPLAQKLNTDDQLRKRLLDADFRELQGIVGIIPRSKSGYTVIKIYDSLPSRELFGIFEIIAKRIKSG